MTTKFKCDECDELFTDPAYYLSDDLGRCPYCDCEYFEEVEVPSLDDLHAADDAAFEAFAAYHKRPESERLALLAQAESVVADLRKTLAEMNSDSLHRSALSAARYGLMDTALDEVVRLARQS